MDYNPFEWILMDFVLREIIDYNDNKIDFVV